VKEIRRILVVMDPPNHDGTALTRARRLAEEFGAHLHLVSFVHHAMYDQDDVFDTHQRLEIRRTLENERSRWLRDQVRDTGMQAMNLDIEVVWSKHIHQWIVDAGNSGEHDLILKTAHRTRTLAHMPTDWHLLRECRIPVWLALPDSDAPRPVVLAALDPTSRDAAHHALDERVLETALACARASDAEVHLGWSLETATVVGGIDAVDTTHHEARMLEVVRPRLEQLAAAHDIPADRIHTTEGPPGTAMEDLARSLDARLTVLGTTARTGIAGLVVGNTAEQVLAHATRDLLAIRA
jgi:universal stress protein E